MTDDDRPFPYIRATDLTVIYPTTASILGFGGDKSGYPALKGLNFELRPGTRLGLLGRNGSGKSTMLRTLAGVYPPASGSLEVDGTVASIFSAQSGFMPNATGYENIFLRGTMLGFSYEEIRGMAPEIIEFADIGDWINQPIFRYSSGMLLRLAFALTTAIKSDILLMDEWLGAGDASFLSKARIRMAEMVENAKILVLASHNLSLIERICEQVMVIDGGEIAHFGSTDEVLAAYRLERDTIFDPEKAEKARLQREKQAERVAQSDPASS
ncbi:ABC transporter ATP-binding protein [Maricaulis sp.]|uniref:ABC transporter ATP-binding protein n=1 Tax=Maricaulis sp. TaxID=1486257 RepID=UPI0025B997B8|nr:ABC transporter ATP-binding protein [Maricaulis sp.]